MTIVYRNPNANAYVASNFSFFRLKQPLASAGDIFESEQGANAFALGPDSDISLATIAYFDPQSTPPYSFFNPPPQTNMSTLTVSPQRTFVASVAAPNKEGQYVPANVPGRILIWPTEIYTPNWRPPGFNVVQDRIVFEPPIIDILQFFGTPQSLVAPRTDKTYYYDRLIFGVDDCYVAIPFYGRRYASISMENTSGTDNFSVSVGGVNFRISETDASVNALLATFTLGFGESITRVIRCDYDSRIGEAPPLTNSNAGLFDYLILQFSPVAGTPNVNLRVVVSDPVG